MLEPNRLLTGSVVFIENKRYYYPKGTAPTNLLLNNPSYLFAGLEEKIVDAWRPSDWTEQDEQNFKQVKVSNG